MGKGQGGGGGSVGETRATRWTVWRRSAQPGRGSRIRCIQWNRLRAQQAPDTRHHIRTPSLREKMTLLKGPQEAELRYANISLACDPPTPPLGGGGGGGATEKSLRNGLNGTSKKITSINNSRSQKRSGTGHREH